MSYTKKTLAKVLLLSLAVSAVGIALLWSAYLAKHDGEITVHRKRTPTFTAYASGATASDFQAEITMRLVTGSILSTGGLCTLLALLLSSPAQRQRTIEAAISSASSHRQRFAIRWSAFTWIALAITVLGVAFALRI